MRTNSDGSSRLLQRDTLADQVLDTLMDWIMDGTLGMGDKLNTNELASRLGVSRMPIREALNRLERMGLAESIPYVGMRLVTLDEDDVLQSYIMRQALEPIVAERVCQNASPEDIERLEMIHREYIDVITDPELNAKELHLKNREFHLTLYSISGMRRVCSSIESLWDTLSFFKLLYGREIIRTQDDIRNMIAEHRGYIDAVKAGDGKLLEQLIYSSLEKRISGLDAEHEYHTREKTPGQ